MGPHGANWKITFEPHTKSHAHSYIDIRWVQIINSQ